MTTELLEINPLDVINNGLPGAVSQPLNVIIVGAGMAGLVAADLLLRAGHNPIILEAQTRVGGRVYTIRAPISDGLYAEAGAMRIPRSHHLTMAYVERFKLPVLPFTMNNPNAFYHLNGNRIRIHEGTANPGSLGYNLAPGEAGKSASLLWETAIAPYKNKLSEQGDSAWNEIVSQCDQYSVREFLESQQWSESAIEMFGLLFNQESLMNSSFLELLREELGDAYTNMVQIDGGMDQLPRSFLPQLKDRIRFGARVVAIDQSPEQVIIHYRTPTGRTTIRADYAILTIPTTIMRHIEMIQPFSPPKQRAIRQLHYDASAKIFFQCRRRFWEEDDGIIGGGSITDLAVRNVFYPEHGKQTGRGVLLASYTWSEDAQRWGSLTNEERLIQALENVAQIHPQVLDEFEGGVSKMWHDDEFAGGAFALFDPSQQTLLHRHIIAAEGRFHFAGEHASLSHAWIQGAIESGIRTAHEIHTRNR
jgi:monoamine oxidase